MVLMIRALGPAVPRGPIEVILQMLSEVEDQVFAFRGELHAEGADALPIEVGLTLPPAALGRASVAVTQAERYMLTSS
jgi:hypothetical protein